MATREETRARREALKQHLREASRQAGSRRSPAPPVRELAGLFNLSVNLVLDVQRELVGEGTLYVESRVGTFLGEAPRGRWGDEPFLVVLPDGKISANNENLRVAFEDAIAQCGGAVLSLELGEAIKMRQTGDLRSVAGVFDLAYTPHGAAWARSFPTCSAPRVRFHTTQADQLGYDEISFDDRDGGRQATRHLLEQDHTRIAYMALHSPCHDTGQLAWSQEREEGWERALLEEGLDSAGLALHPLRDGSPDDSAIEEGFRMAAAVLDTRATAVVAANDYLAEGLLRALREACTPPANWPAIVGFDARPVLARATVTSLRLPWNNLGNAAAELLWARAHGQESGPPLHREVPLKLIPRLTCRPRPAQIAVLGAAGHNAAELAVS